MSLSLGGLLRIGARAAVGLGLLVLVVLLVWVASNWSDDAPLPVPPQLQPVRKPGSPMFFRAQGLMAPASASPEAVGRREWQHIMATGKPPADVDKATGITPMKGPPLGCRAPADCAQLLATSTAQVAQQLRPMALLGERCVRLLGDVRYEEPLPLRLHLASMLPHFVGFAQCEWWFKGQALLDAAADDRASALQRLRDGRRLADTVMQHSVFLIGKMIGGAMARSHFDGINAVALMRPEWVSDLAALLAPLPPAALDPREWIATEAATHRGSLEGMLADCAKPGYGLAGGWRQLRAFGIPADHWSLAGDLACQSSIGMQPNATLQAHDRAWLELWTLAGSGLENAVDRLVARHAERPPSTLGSLTWRNTFGTQWSSERIELSHAYFARQLDFELHRQALALALRAMAQKVTPADRAAWLDRQGLPARQRSRIQLTEQAAVLEVRPWAAEFVERGPAKEALRVRIAAR